MHGSLVGINKTWKLTLWVKGLQIKAVSLGSSSNPYFLFLCTVQYLLQIGCMLKVVLIQYLATFSVLPYSTSRTPVDVGGQSSGGCPIFDSSKCDMSCITMDSNGCLSCKCPSTTVTGKIIDF